jgi:hypothetical protein
MHILLPQTGAAATFKTVRIVPRRARACAGVALAGRLR